MGYSERKIDLDAMISRLMDLDESLQESGLAANNNVMIVVGGSALILRGQTDRKLTKDIDVLEASTAILARIHDHDSINADARVYGDCIPYNYEDRLEELNLHLANLRVATPSLEDLVVMKLYASRGVDDEDLTSIALLKDIDWDLLDRLVLSEDEAKSSILADQDYKRLVTIYRDYRGKYGPESDPVYEWPPYYTYGL